MYKTMLDMTISAVFDRYLVLIKALMVPFILMTIIRYFHTGNTVEVNGVIEIQSYGMLFLTAAANWIIYILVAISCHRLFLLEDNSIPEWGYFRFTQREWVFFVNSFLLGLIVGAIGFFILLITSAFGMAGLFVGGILFGLVSSIIISRISLVFPTIAIDKQMTFTEAWKITKDYKLFVFISVVLFPVLFTLTFGMIYGVAIAFVGTMLQYDLSFLESIVGIISTVLTISALSATYKLIRDAHPEYFEPKQHEAVEIRDIAVKQGADNQEIVIHDASDISFEGLKSLLQEQYYPLGFLTTTVDKEDAWMIKHMQYPESYVLLAHEGDDYTIEIYHAEKVRFLDKLQSITSQEITVVSSDSPSQKDAPL